MKQLTCEMCGSTNLVKQDGVFVCQSCGTKYSIEEARKMMVEGTVDVKGTVKVDTSDELANLYQIARRARDDNNAENASKYYDMILIKDPTSWEASFYLVYFRAMQCKIGEIRSAAVSVSNCEDSVLSLIRDHVPVGEQKAAVEEVALRSYQIASMLANASHDTYYGIDDNIRLQYTDEFYDRLNASVGILADFAQAVEDIFPGNPEICAAAGNSYKLLVQLYALCDREIPKNVLFMKRRYIPQIRRYDPDHAAELETEVLTTDQLDIESELNALRSARESRLSQLRGQLAKIPEKPGWSIPWLVPGAVLLFYLVRDIYDALRWGVPLSLLLRSLMNPLPIAIIVCGLLCVWKAAPRKAKVEKNKQRRSALEAQIADAESSYKKAEIEEKEAALKRVEEALARLMKQSTSA